MLPTEFQRWKTEVHGLHLHLLEALERFGVVFSWKPIEKTVCWFGFRSQFQGRIFEHAPCENSGYLRETVEWVVLKTGQVLQAHHGFVYPINLSAASVSDQWVARWTDVTEDPSF